MGAAIRHSHRNTGANTAVVSPEARLIPKSVKDLVPAEGLSATCATPVVVGVVELQGNPEAEFNTETSVNGMLNLEACGEVCLGKSGGTTCSGVLQAFWRRGRSGSFDKRHF